jgi:predicted DNA-binding transcriptional regulator AlpA
MLDEQITFDELRLLGCPDVLLMQYLGWTRKQIYDLLKKSEDV